jgi:capsular polysaccharide transport system permease protein
MNKNNSFVFFSVIKALFFREIKTRFGNSLLGYIWAFLEPLSHVLVLGSIFTLVGRDSIQNIPFFYFLGISIMSWFLFSNTFSKVSSGIQANQGLFLYKQVKIFDVMLTRAIVEYLLFLFSFATFQVFAYFYFEKFYFNNLFGVILISLLISALGYSLGIIFGILFQFNESLKKIVNVFIRLLYFSAGIFFTFEKIPYIYQHYFLYNPIFVLINDIRHFYFGNNFELIRLNEQSYIVFLLLFLFNFGFFLNKFFEKSILRG